MSGPLSTAAQTRQKAATRQFDDQSPGAQQQCPKKFWVDIRLYAFEYPRPWAPTMEYAAFEFYRAQLPDATERTGMLGSIGEFYAAEQPSGTAQIAFEKFFAEIDEFCGDLAAARAKTSAPGGR